MCRFITWTVSIWLVASPATGQNRVGEPSCPTVTTAGENIVRVAPDRATLTLTSEARAREPERAREQSAAAMTAVLAKLKALGVAADSMRTLRVELHPEFDFADGERTRRGYVAANTIAVRLDNLSRVGIVIDAAVQAGANVVTGVAFELSDREQRERDALKQAVANARARADAAAIGAGRSIEEIIRIVEQNQSHQPPIPLMMTARAEQASTPIIPGLIEIRAAVTLTACMR